MATLTAKPESLSIIKQKVKKAYFAKRVVTGSKASNETYSYTFTGSSNNTKTQEAKKNIAGIIYKKIKPDLDKNNQTTSVDEITKALTKDSYKKPDKVTFALTKDTVRFDGLKEASLGDEVYIYIETENIPAGREIKMNFRQGGDSKVITEVGEGIFVTQEGSKAANKLFTATVGTFSEEKSVANAADFEHFAIAKVKLASSNDDDNKKYKEALDKAEGKKTQFYIVMDAEPDGQDWFEVQYEEIVDNRPNAWYYGEGNWLDFSVIKKINEYHIYHDGKIEKLIYDEENKENKYIYIYHDSSNNEHQICEVDRNITKEKKNGVTYKTKPTHSEVEYDNNVNEGSTERRVKYTNGDIAEYGKHPTKGNIWRLYKATSKDVELVKMPDGLTYTKDDLSIRYKFSSTKRRYTGANCLAGFIGALADCKIEITTTGSCFSEASCFPSSEHVNGKSVDTIYMWDKKKDQKIIDAMDKFYFSKILVGNKSYFSDLKKCEDGGSLHNSHLHSGNFNNSKIKIVTK